MNLIGIHMKEAPRWPLKFGKNGPPDIPGSINFHTCNRFQFLCEPPQRDHVLEYFREELRITPTEYVNKSCVRKLTEISFGLDSVNLGSTIVRKQMLEAKNRSGTRFLKNVVSSIVDVSETIIPYPGYRQFTAAKYFMNNLLGIKDVHIVTAGEIVAGGIDCFSYWHPDAFECEGVIFAGSINSIPFEVLDCKYCINFSMRFVPPIGMNDITELFDSYISRGGPLIQNVEPIADLLWYKFENELMKKSIVRDLKHLGLSSNEIETIFDRAYDRKEYIDLA